VRENAHRLDLSKAGKQGLQWRGRGVARNVTQPYCNVNMDSPSLYQLINLHSARVGWVVLMSEIAASALP
jgi:hypothetical protein